MLAWAQLMYRHVFKTLLITVVLAAPPAFAQAQVGHVSTDGTCQPVSQNPIPPGTPWSWMYNSTGQLCIAITATTLGTVTTVPGTLTIVPLDVNQVTTGGTAVNALNAGHRTKGGWLTNPIAATVALCINEIGAASGTTSSGNTTCIQPGDSYALTPSGNAVSVVTSDSLHPFSGYGYN